MVALLAEHSEAPGSKLTAGIGLITVITETGEKEINNKSEG